MTKPQTSTATTPTPAAHAGVKQGLPTVGLPQAEQSAEKLWEVARRGMTSKQLFGSSIGMPSVIGSSFRTRLALLRGFGLIKVNKEQLGLTDLGLQLVQAYDEDARRSARRTAILSLKAYREIVTTFDGTALPPKDRLTAKLKFEYGKTDAFATQAAEAVIESLKYAEMLDSNNVVYSTGIATENHAGIVPENQETASSDGEEMEEVSIGDVEASEEDEVAAELDAAFGSVDDGDEDSQEADAASKKDQQMLESKARNEVSLKITLDLSQFRADEVIQILQALGLSKHG